MASAARRKIIGGGAYKFALIRRLEVFEIWVRRRMEKTSWRDMKTNEEVGYTTIGTRKKEVFWI